MVVFICMAFSFVVIIIVLFTKRDKRGPPSPPGLPLIGNLHQIDATNRALSLSQLAKKYGPIMSLKFGPTSVLVISSAEAAKQALKDNDFALSGRRSTTAGKRLSYGNIDIVSATYTSSWRERRKLAVLNLFTLKQVRSFRPIRESEVSSMIEEIRERAGLGRYIDLSETLISFSSGLICRIAFGKKYNEGGAKKFDDLVYEVQHNVVAFFFGDNFPWLRWVDKLSGKVWRLEKVFKELDSFYEKLIEQHLDPNRPESMNNDILDLLIQLRNEQNTSDLMDWNNIKAILMNIFLAGIDTTSASITWAMTALMKNPSVMKRVQEEIRSSIGNKGLVDEDDIEKLPYLNAVVKETLRLYPPVPLSIPRETIERCTINRYQIRPKTNVLVNVWAIGRDPEYWKDPDEFLPERFLNSNIDFRGHDFGLLPFGAGRRSCPGLNLGVAAVELALANLLCSFDWELPTGMRIEDIDTQALPGIVAHKKHTLCLMAKRYTQMD